MSVCAARSGLIVIEPISMMENNERPRQIGRIYFTYNLMLILNVAMKKGSTSKVRDSQ